MIDNFALVLTHGLLAIALVRLMLRRDLDHDVAADSAGEEPPTQRRRIGVEHRAEKGPARMAVRHAQHIEQQPERRAEPQRQRHLPELGERVQAHPPNRRDQKPPPDAVSSV